MKTLIEYLMLSLLFVNLHSQEPIKINNDLNLLQLQTGVYLHTSFKTIEPYGRIGENGLVVITDSGSVITDTPWDDKLSAELIEWIENNLDTKIAAVIVTHSHDDCAGGLAAFEKRSIKSYGLDITRSILQQEQKAFPQIVFSDSLILKIGGKNFELFYPGAGHAIDNITVWMPEQKILFGGCLIKALENNSLGNTKDANIKNWPLAVQKVWNRYPMVEVIIPGHGKPGNNGLFNHTINLISNQ
jgi:metallo-beta-lactamase class B